MLAQIVAWIRVKHTTLTQAAATVVGAGQVLGWWDLSREQLAAVMSLVGLIWLIIGANTVTSNLRLTGRAFASTSGVDINKVAEVALGSLGSVPAVADIPPVAQAAPAVPDVPPVVPSEPVDLSDVIDGAGLG